MAIFVGQFGDPFTENLATEYQNIAGSESNVFHYCTKRFRGGEYKIRVVDEHCGKDPSECDNKCKNPRELGKMLPDNDVFFVVRGKYGDGWSSDMIHGIAEQGAELFRSGSPEYFGGKTPRRFYGVIPHEGFTKQDHLFTDEIDGETVRLEGEAITIRMKRRILKAMGYDYVFTVYPHDYRREGWVRKVAKKGHEDQYVTDWRDIPRRQRVGLENWQDFLWAVDPTELIPEYIKKKGIKLNIVAGPDYTSTFLATAVKKGIGLWVTDNGDDFIDKRRSRTNADETEVKNGLDPQKVRGKSLGFVDDLFLTGGTIRNGIIDADECGVREIHVFGVHGEFADDAWKKLNSMELKNARGPFFHLLNTVDNPAAVIPVEEKLAQSLYYVPENYYLGD